MKNTYDVFTHLNERITILVKIQLTEFESFNKSMIRPYLFIITFNCFRYEMIATQYI